MLRKISLLLVFTFCCQQIVGNLVHAQIGILRRAAQKEANKAIDKEIETKVKEPAREDIKKDVYSDKSDFPAPENRVNATFLFEMTSFKKNGEQQRDPMKTRLIFGKTGECYVMNDGNEQESWMIFDYSKNACFLANVKQKTATKMPLVNLKKMIMKRAEKTQRLDEQNSGGQWTKTNEKKVINGFNCQKYVYDAEDGSKMEAWVTLDIQIDLSGNHILGGSIKGFQIDESAAKATDPNMPRGMMVRNISFDKKERKTMQMDLLSFEKSANKKYFDLSEFQKNDIIDGLF